MEQAAQHQQEIESGERFSFGENWSRFLSTLNNERIETAKASLSRMLETDRLQGKTFIDVGCGSGLFSLSASLLGADVSSFDYDPKSVACTKYLKEKYQPNNARWKVFSGSVLDKPFLTGLGTYDIVYSWGVLHHTGKMWEALENVVPLVAPGGMLYIAIYNDQGFFSRTWTWIKKLYNGSGKFVRGLLLAAVTAQFIFGQILRALVNRQNPFPWTLWRKYGQERGMSAWHDIVDWVGGYPFEVAKPEEIFEFYKKRGFSLRGLVTRKGGHGCCEYVFRRD